MMLKKLMENIRGNNCLKNKHIRKMFKLDLIREESDLHQYKNLLNAMAALFYTNHQMTDVGGMFEKWRQVYANLKKQKRPKIPIIDTELANKQYKASQKQQEEAPVVVQEIEDSVRSMNSDDVADQHAKKFLDLIRKVGPHSKQILNYSYPPLLYQRGEEDEDESQEHEGECDEEEEDDNSHIMGDSDNQLP
jgi:fructose-bisphosphate aldolase class 1